MPDPRETYILEQDIAEGQIVDAHLKPGSLLRKLVEKKVIDTIYLDNLDVPVGATSRRLDLNLLDIPYATGPQDLGIPAGRKHQVFQVGTNYAFLDTQGKEVTAEIVFTPAVNFQVQLITGSNQGTTVGDPGDVQVGDTVRVRGQGLVSPFVSPIVNKVQVWPNFVLTFQNNFVHGQSKTYAAERIGRWEVFFRDSQGNPYSIPTDHIDLGVFRRVYLADILEHFGTEPLRRPELAPQVGWSVPPPPGAPFSSVTIELMLDPGENFLWFHGLDTDIPLLTWWVEWPGYPVVRFYYGLQAILTESVNEHIEGVPSLRTTTPVDFKHIDRNYIEIKNRDTISHRVKAIAFKGSL